MWEFVVSGYIPGTNMKISFYAFLMFTLAGLILGAYAYFKGRQVHKQRSMQVAKTVVQSLIERVGIDPIQLKLIK